MLSSTQKVLQNSKKHDDCLRKMKAMIVVEFFCLNIFSSKQFTLYSKILLTILSQYAFSYHSFPKRQIIDCEKFEETFLFYCGI